MHAHRVARWDMVGREGRKRLQARNPHLYPGRALSDCPPISVHLSSIYLPDLPPCPPALPPLLVTLIAADIVLAPPFIFLPLLPLPPGLLLPAFPLPSSSFSALSFFFPYSLPLPSPPLSLPLSFHPSLSYRWAALKYIVLLTSQL